jgi:nitroreductase
MNSQLPDPRTVRSALELASRAPSLNNSQPWRWRLAPSSVHLYADFDRQLTVVDPSGRELIISCGTLLHHVRVAFGSLGWRVRVNRLPNPAEPGHLAALEFSRLAEVDEQAVRLANAASTRHSDRRPYLPDRVPDELLGGLVAVAEAEHGNLTVVSSEAHRRDLIVALAQVNTVQRTDPAYQAEVAAWAGRSHVAREGVPASNLRAPDPFGRSVLGRDFSPAGPGELVSAPIDDGAVLAVLSTELDDRGGWLRTGEALSAVLLEATAAGLATCTLSQVAESRVARDLIRSGILSGVGEPQVALRIGWPVTADFPAPLTRRRPFDEIVEHQANQNM